MKCNRSEARHEGSSAAARFPFATGISFPHHFSASERFSCSLPLFTFKEVQQFLFDPFEVFRLRHLSLVPDQVLKPTNSTRKLWAASSISSQWKIIVLGGFMYKLHPSQRVPKDGSEDPITRQE